MSDTTQILGDLSKAVISLAKSTFGSFGQAAEADSMEFLKESKVDLEKWTIELANGDIDQDDFTSLIKGQKDLLVMNALTEKGIALSTLEQFRNKVIDLVLSTVIKAV